LLQVFAAFTHFGHGVKSAYKGHVEVGGLTHSSRFRKFPLANGPLQEALGLNFAGFEEGSDIPGPFSMGIGQFADAINHQATASFIT